MVLSTRILFVQASFLVGATLLPSIRQQLSSWDSTRTRFRFWSTPSRATHTLWARGHGTIFSLFPISSPGLGDSMTSNLQLASNFDRTLVGRDRLSGKLQRSHAEPLIVTLVWRD